MTFLAALRHTLASMLGDKGALMPAVGGVIVYCFFYPLPYLPQAVHEIPVAVVDADASPLSRGLARNLDATQELAVVGVARTVDEVLPMLNDGRIGGIVAIPGNFRRDIERGTPTGITVMANGGLIVLDGSVQAAAAKATAATVAPSLAVALAHAGVPAAAVARAERAGPLFVKQPLFNTVAGYESYVVAASMGLILMQLLVIAVAMVVGTWTEKGAWPAARGARLGAGAFAGLIAGFALVVFTGLLFWSGFVFWYHDLPRAGNLPGTVAFSALYATTVAAFGVGLGAWMGERERALQFVAAASIPLLFFSGFAFPAESFTAPVRVMALPFPSTPGIQGFIALNQMGARWSEIQPQLLHLSVLCVAYCALAWLAASRRARAAGPTATRGAGHVHP